MRALIIGCTPIGAMTAERLVGEGHRVTIMDARPERFAALPEDLDAETIVGDGARNDDLFQAGARDAEFFLAATESDTLNGLAAQTARHAFQINKVVCIVEDPELHELYRDLGMDAVCPALRAFELVQRVSRS